VHGTRVPELEGEGRQGATFVTVLFAIAATAAIVQIIEGVRAGYLASDLDAIYGIRVVQLVLALVVLGVSWLLYHRVVPGPRLLLGAVDAPLVSLAAAVAVVGVGYSILAFAEVEGTASGGAISPSARPESVLVVILFALYLVWDGARPREAGRLPLTAGAFAASVVVALVIGLVEPRGTAGVTISDVVLIVLVVAYGAAALGTFDGDDAPADGTEVVAP
jgi:hypothetical protein